MQPSSLYESGSRAFKVLNYSCGVAARGGDCADSDTGWGIWGPDVWVLGFGRISVF